MANCPGCSAENEEGAAVCTSCGASLEAAGGTEEAAAEGGEATTEAPTEEGSSDEASA